MSADVTAEAVVLHRTNAGENDRRLTLLTREFGKIDVFAKGARKSGSRLAGSSEPLVRAVFTWASGRVRRFVTQVQPQSSYPRIRSDYDRTLAGLALAELVAVSLPYESQDPDAAASEYFYSLVVNSLESLESVENWKPTSVWFQAKLMEAEGVHPDWLSCAADGSRLSVNPAWVSPKAGGYVSESHALQFADRFLATAECLIALSKVASFESPPAVIQTVDECLRVQFAFWRHSLETRLPANEALIQGLPAKLDTGNG